MSIGFDLSNIHFELSSQVKPVYEQAVQKSKAFSSCFAADSRANMGKTQLKNNSQLILFLLPLLDAGKVTQVINSLSLAHVNLTPNPRSDGRSSKTRGTWTVTPRWTPPRGLWGTWRGPWRESQSPRTKLLTGKDCNLPNQNLSQVS